ncbi:alkyl hydroperoxide reductase subunit F [Bacillus thuringiensis serovar pingluonsis]|uniref:Alkyl hydroperoxide reductase subunit F n=3 Tax=Bacillus cereus group TaxID=86661 RepID=A0A1J9XTW8_9BACI|nr:MULTISPECIES: alkyl hydroperoxide reductase subunit F [Bacillus]ADY19688.1 alkyl hydroperoxide reductase subunit F [Bacillus thuringiensis serovar finitimus YBT-020]EEK46755.1 NADH dehydrogenase [Bacillus cereus m1293]EEL47538.1 NADH dehydrogenase [Bacillus cereus Rock3-42]EJR11335.1 NADH dehydrogenase [Bacillus cereus MSX-D12]EJR46224.1 NADH dehydrogenase [Bacillus cereus VD102]MCW4574693.1 alkyl hydroperoxide reductase subunit F [Bacillus pacificus]MDD1367809.1 alkyl hydroperoxide reduc
MILDADIKTQLSQYLQLMENDILLKVSAGDDDVSKDMLALVDELATMSSKITVEKVELERTPSFSVNRPGEDTGVVFAGIPLGHEFTSLVLALLQVSGRAPKVEQKLIDQIKNIQGEYHFESYISLSCHNCPDVVQALNVMSVLNSGITHTMIDGAAFKEEVESKDIMAVPTVFLNGESFGSGRMTLEEILAKMGNGPDASELSDKDPYDVLVVGGGPAGASAAIYAARKGIRTGIVAERFGGQVMDTMGIENFISVKRTEGPKLVASLEEHVKEYDIDVMNLQRAKRLEKKELIEVELENGAILKSKSVIVSTGARWRNVGVPGEAEFKNKGVAYCPHCDGPLFTGKDVAVIGGGNSGIEAAIDLAGIVKHVTVLEFMPELKADAVLQERLNSLPNVTVLKNVQTKEITGTDKVNGISYIDRETEEVHHVELQGVFVQIGLVPNTDWLGETVERVRGEIVTDKHGATNVPGVFAAGDCTNNPYKQIIISMGSGANAALGAFDYLIRN